MKLMKSAKKIVRNENIGNPIIFDFTDLDTNISDFFKEIFDDNEEDILHISYGENESDFNLLNVHHIIRAKLSYELISLPKLYDEIESLEKANEKASPVYINANNNEIKKLKQEIDSVENNIKWEKYKSETIDILNNWAKIASNKCKGVLMLSKETPSPDIIKQRIEYMDQYFRIIDKLNIIKLNIDKQDIINLTCPLCKEVITEKSDEENICVCGYRPEIMSDKHEISTEIEISPVQRSSVDNQTFVKAIARYEGVSGETIPDKVYKDLDEYFVKNNGPTSEQVKQNKELQEFMDLKILIKALKETGNSKYYNNLNLIRHNYWGRDLPCLDNCREQLMKYFTISQHAYNKFKTKVSSINIHIRMYLLLRAVGHECMLKDFKIPEGEESITYPDTIWSKICEETGIPYYSIKG